MTALRALPALLLFASIATSAELATLSGKKLTGEIVAVDAKGVVVRVGTSEQSFPLNDVVVVDLGNAAKDLEKTRIVAVELTDGTTLNCSQFEIRGKTAKLVLAAAKDKTGRSLEVPNTKLFTVLKDAQEAKSRLDFQSLVNRRGKRDMMVIRRGNVLDSVEGTFGDGDDAGKTINFEFALNGMKNAVNVEGIQGMVFNQLPTNEAVPAICKVTDIYKNVLFARTVAVKDKGLSITTVSGMTVDYPSLAEVSKLDFSSSVLRYLSDLEPKAEYEAGLLGDRHYGKDRNLDSPTTGKGDPIRFGSKEYQKGIALHATTHLTYDIGGQYKSFRATVGSDNTANSDSAAIIVIQGDGRELWKGVVKGKDEPKEVALNIRDVKQLRISVSPDEGRTDLFNQATLADAKVTK